MENVGQQLDSGAPVLNPSPSAPEDPNKAALDNARASVQTKTITVEEAQNQNDLQPDEDCPMSPATARAVLCFHTFFHG